MGITEKIKSTIEMLKDSEINGCITGSSLLDEDFDTWTEIPDVDVFCYTYTAYAVAVQKLLDKGYQLGLGDIKSAKAEAWKYNRAVNKETVPSTKMCTTKVNRDGIIVNVTWKKDCKAMVDVLSKFDMSIIMKGYDIHKGIELDLTTIGGNDKRTAIPNPLRDQDFDLFTTRQWIRQFDRVIKYWQRGFDTRPMARYYLKAIDECVATGSLFNSEASQAVYDEFVMETTAVRPKIQQWLDEKDKEVGDIEAR